MEMKKPGLPDPRLAHPINELTKTTCVKQVNMPSGMINYLDTVLEPNDDPESAGFNQMRLERLARTYHLESSRVTADIEKDQIEVMNKMYGIDMRDQIKSVLVNEDSQTLERKILSTYSNMGIKTAKTMLTSRQLWFKKYFKNLKFPLFVYGERDQDTARILTAKILMASNFIATKSRRGPANFVIVSPQVGSMLQDCAGFEYKGTSGVTMNPTGLVYQIGSIAGIRILTDPFMKWTDNTILTGRDTKDGEPGTYLIEGHNDIGRGFEEVQYFDDPMGRSKLALGTRRAIITTEGASNMYLQQEIVFKKRPWWRRLFKI